jgi:hypothetical protein
VAVPGLARTAPLSRSFVGGTRGAKLPLTGHRTVPRRRRDDTDLSPADKQASLLANRKAGAGTVSPAPFPGTNVTKDAGRTGACSLRAFLEGRERSQPHPSSTHRIGLDCVVGIGQELGAHQSRPPSGEAKWEPPPTHIPSARG